METATKNSIRDLEFDFRVVDPPAQGPRRRARCKHGHSLADAYIYEQTRNGKKRIVRACRTCSLAASKRWAAQNNERARATSRRWQDANPERVKAYRSGKIFRSMAERRYRARGISREQFEAVLIAQGNRCAGCAIEIDDEMQLAANGRKTMTNRTAVIDHDHATGKFRGLLCPRCNTALGYLRDDPESARRLAAYLEERR